MDDIIFADGSKHKAVFFSVIPDLAFVALAGANEAEMREIFSDPEKTKTITSGGTVADGYTVLEDVFPQPYGFQAVLSKPKKEE